MVKLSPLSFLLPLRAKARVLLEKRARAIDDVEGEAATLGRLAHLARLALACGTEAMV
jgi:hypothetical protein